MEDISNSSLDQVPDSVLLDPGLALKTPVPPEPPSGPSVIQLLCVRCWSSFDGFSRSVCPRCGADRPRQGWATMPYTFRDRYLFWRLLGRGGMGAVFLAYDEHQVDQEKKAVAIKVVPQTSSSSAAETLKRMFEREAAAASMLAQSPHFVRVTSHDVGVEPAYLVMEYVDWPTLRGLLRRGQGKVRPLSPVKVARIGIALLRGLSTMHFHRIVHRDLKPDNIFVRRAAQGDEYEIKILDLGVWAKDALSQPGGGSMPGGRGEDGGSPVGTFSYMSPEQMASQPVGSVSDLHTVGSVLWELATGRVPYPMRQKELAPAMRDRMERLKKAPDRPESMPEGLYEILVKALSFQLQDRWESAEEMKSALKVWVAEELLRTEAAVGEAAKRLGVLEKQTEALRQQLAPGALLIQQLQDFNERIGTLRGHAEEASPLALGRSIAEAEAVHQRLSEELDCYVRNVERGLQEHGALPHTEDLEPAARKERLKRRGEDVRPRPRIFVERAMVAALTFAVVTGGTYLMSLDPGTGARLGRSALELRDELSRSLGLGAATPTAVAAPKEPKLVGPVEPTPKGPLDGLSSDAYADALLGTGHGGGYVGVSFSSSSPVIASGSADSTVRLWSSDDGQYLGKLLGHEGVVFETSFSPDGRLIATACEDGAVRLYELASRRSIATLRGHKQVVRAVAFSADGALLASGGEDGTVRLWSVATGKELRRLTGKKGRRKAGTPVRSLAFSPKGTTLAVAGNDGTITLFDAHKGEATLVFTAHEGGAYGVAFSPDGSLLVSGGFDRRVRIWSAQGEPVAVLEGHEHQVRSVAFSPDGTVLASAGFDRTVRLWSAEGQPLRTLTGHRGPVYQVAFSSDGNHIASGGHDKAVRVWNVDDGTLVREHAGREGLILSVAVDPTGTLLASGGHDATVRLFFAQTGALARTLEGHKGWVQSVAFSRDGKRVASASHDKTIRVWSTATGETLRTLEAHESWVRTVAFSPDGQTLASGSDDRTLRLWDLETGAERMKLTAHKSDVRTIAFSPDGAMIASAGDDRVVRLWSTSTGQIVRAISGASGALRALAFSPDGVFIATAGDDRVLRVYDTRSGELVRAHEGHEGSIRGVDFSPDGKLLATGSLDRTVKVWAVDGPHLIANLQGHELGVESIAFARDGQRILSGGYDSTRRLWDWPSGAWMSMGMGPGGWVVFDDRGRVECAGAPCTGALESGPTAERDGARAEATALR